VAQSYKFVINGTTRNLVSDYGLTVTQMLGGTVACDSAPGQGVRFLVKFPQGDLGAA